MSFDFLDQFRFRKECRVPHDDNESFTNGDGPSTQRRLDCSTVDQVTDPYQNTASPTFGPPRFIIQVPDDNPPGVDRSSQFLHQDTKTCLNSFKHQPRTMTDNFKSNLSKFKIPKKSEPLSVAEENEMVVKLKLIFTHRTEEDIRFALCSNKYDIDSAAEQLRQWDRSPHYKKKGGDYNRPRKRKISSASGSDSNKKPKPSLDTDTPLDDLAAQNNDKILAKFMSKYPEMAPGFLKNVLIKHQWQAGDASYEINLIEADQSNDESDADIKEHDKEPTGTNRKPKRKPTKMVNSSDEDGDSLQNGHHSSVEIKGKTPGDDELLKKGKSKPKRYEKDSDYCPSSEEDPIPQKDGSDYDKIPNSEWNNDSTDDQTSSNCVKSRIAKGPVDSSSDDENDSKREKTLLNCYKSSGINTIISDDDESDVEIVDRTRGMDEKSVKNTIISSDEEVDGPTPLPISEDDDQSSASDNNRPNDVIIATDKPITDEEDGHVTNDTDSITSGKSSGWKRRKDAGQRSTGSGKKKNGKTVMKESIPADDESDYSVEDEDEMNTQEKCDVLNFFETATIPEINIVPGCSMKKSARIIQLRPFKSWTNLVNQFYTVRGVNMDTLYKCRDVLRERATLRSLMSKCEKMAVSMQRIATGLLGDINTMQIDKQPSILSETLQLKHYQLIGLNWLNLLHSQNVNGILADEMGLGKTVQTIAFLAHLMQQGIPGPHLVIVPSSTVDNWVREVRQWCPTMKLIMYFGSQSERRAIRYDLLKKKLKCNIIITTYHMCCSHEDKRLFTKQLYINYAVFDEGHMLKNMSSQRYHSLMKINAVRRLLLTGTPLQNNLLELMSLLCFVMPHLFKGKIHQIQRLFMGINKGVSDDVQGDFERERIDHAKQIMKPFILRRIKTDVIKQLPTKRNQIINVKMTDTQSTLYTQLAESLSNTLTTGSSGNGTLEKSKISGFMMQLRKMSNHSLLHRCIYNDRRLDKMSKLMLKEPTHTDANSDLIFEDMCVMSDFELHRLCQRYSILSQFMLSEQDILNSGKFHQLDELLPLTQENDDRVLLFSQFTMMLDIIEVYMEIRGYRFLRLDGTTPVTDRQGLIDKFNIDKEIFVFLLSTRAGGLGINLTAASVVILHDIDYNPYNDKQAEDRCHRLGQTRDVTVYRLISMHSIEEQILKSAQGKLQLEHDITERSTSGNDFDMAELLKGALQLKS